MFYVCNVLDHFLTNYDVYKIVIQQTWLVIVIEIRKINTKEKGKVTCT